MNPARTFASALPGDLWHGLWVYFVGPAAGMLLAVEAYRLRPPARARLKFSSTRRSVS
jgi:glycerol uptake facilitator-like aquaporin